MNNATMYQIRGWACAAWLMLNCRVAIRHLDAAALAKIALKKPCDLTDQDIDDAILAYEGYTKDTV